MGIINVLDPHVANLIAAGEVVERPASVVKELLENAIDAKADQITCEIKKGGISFIRVTDNGCGMKPEDVPICLQRHATSKIRSEIDLDGIATLGFRGEALAAISSVSKLRIMTKTEDEVGGVILESEGGNVISVTESGCPTGTTIIVEELFANVPARRKFLKRDVSEAAAVSAVVEKIALSRPDIAIRFVSDENVKFATTGNGKLADAIYAVLGRDYAKKLIKVDEVNEGVSVYGYIGAPESCRGNRNYQNFFLNGRYIKSSTMTAALEQAFSTYIPSEKYPCCVLNLVLNPSYVDVNVHPTKLEVKFSDERTIFNSVYCSVRNALTTSTTRPEIVGKENKKNYDYVDRSLENISLKLDSAEKAMELANQREESKNGYSQIGLGEIRHVKIIPDLTEPEITIPDITEKQEEIQPKIPENTKETEPISEKIPENHSEAPICTPLQKPEILAEENQTTEKSPEPEKKSEIPALTESDEKIKEIELPVYKIIGVAFDCYIFVETGNKLMVIDKHAAHERIIFEELKKNMRSDERTSQIMLVPIRIKLTQQEYAAVYEYSDEINATGYDFYSTEENGCVELISVPSLFDTAVAADAFVEMAGKLAEATSNAGLIKEQIYEKALFRASCKAAMKGGRQDGEEHIHWLCDQLFSNPEIKTCPHGRPVAFEMSKSQLESRFGRI